MPALTEHAFWVLTVLTEGPHHGYAVLKRTEELSEGNSALRVTTLYATLERLQQQGLITVVSEEVVEGRARRTYSITAGGRGLLAAEAERLLARAQTAQRRLQPATQPGPHLGGQPGHALGAAW